VDLNHFFPRDPSLPVSLQDPNKLAPPPPSQTEIDRRNARFDRIHGYRRWPQKYRTRETDDWKIINGK
jgi:hypothetical protein